MQALLHITTKGQEESFRISSRGAYQQWRQHCCHSGLSGFAAGARSSGQRSQQQLQRFSRHLGARVLKPVRTLSSLCLHAMPTCRAVTAGRLQAVKVAQTGKRSFSWAHTLAVTLMRLIVIHLYLTQYT